jgi:hypothetical protein
MPLGVRLASYWVTLLLDLATLLVCC